LLFLRSLAFNAAFYVTTLIQMVFWTPVFFFLPHDLAWQIPRAWARINLWLQQTLTGARFEFRGLHNIPRDRNFIVASKHQSSWETYTGLLFFEDPSFILKRELMFIPLFGWYAAKMRVVPVNRGQRAKALASMAANSAEQYEGRRQIIIYPEGTRTQAGAEPNYKYGITHLYAELGATILPVAVNSGLFWPRQSFLRYPGKFVMEFLEPVEPGLSKAEFAAELQRRIETATARLIAETADTAPQSHVVQRLRAQGKIA
jgi:1-acyl-sn-glycerol-3-phosphate acyltransferase